MTEEEIEHLSMSHAELGHDSVKTMGFSSINDLRRLSPVMTLINETYSTLLS